MNPVISFEILFLPVFLEWIESSLFIKNKINFKKPNFGRTALLTANSLKGCL